MGVKMPLLFLFSGWVHPSSLMTALWGSKVSTLPPESSSEIESPPPTHTHTHSLSLVRVSRAQNWVSLAYWAQLRAEECCLQISCGALGWIGAQDSDGCPGGSQGTWAPGITEKVPEMRFWAVALPHLSSHFFMLSFLVEFPTVFRHFTSLLLTASVSWIIPMVLFSHLVIESCLNPFVTPWTVCSLPGSSVHEIS